MKPLSKDAKKELVWVLVALLVIVADLTVNPVNDFQYYSAIFASVVFIFSYAKFRMN